MARLSSRTAIQQKITELTAQVTHFEQCIQTAKQHIDTLKQALIALNSEPFSKQYKAKTKPQVSQTYTSCPSAYVSKVFRHYPNQWLSTTEVIFKSFEIEGKKPDKSDFNSITTSFSQVLRRFHKKGFIERSERSSKPVWKAKEIEIRKLD